MLFIQKSKAGDFKALTQQENDGFKLTVTDAFLYGQKKGGSNRFLVYHDKSRDIFQVCARFFPERKKSFAIILLINGPASIHPRHDRQDRRECRRNGQQIGLHGRQAGFWCSRGHLRGPFEKVLGPDSKMQMRQSFFLWQHIWHQCGRCVSGFS